MSPLRLQRRSHPPTELRTTERAGAPPARGARRHGFTLLELLIALVILVLATGICFMTFSNISRAWQRGTALSKDLSHGDFVMDQLTMALRSAYFVAASGTNQTSYGFWMDDGGDGESARDSISWVKLGGSLMGMDSPVVNAPHRVKVTVEDVDNGGSGFAVKGWSPYSYAQPEDFKSEDLPWTLLSKEIVGFNCRVTTNATEGELEWEDTWDDTNNLPSAVELTLYLKPLDAGEPAVELKRYVTIPVGPPLPRKK